MVLFFLASLCLPLSIFLSLSHAHMCTHTTHTCARAHNEHIATCRHIYTHTLSYALDTALCTCNCLPWLREPGNQAVDEIYYCNETVDPSFVFVSTTTTKSKDIYNIQRRRKRTVAANTSFVLKCVLDFIQGTVVSCISRMDLRL